jgi:outer membrane biosynthesis protein TonB
VNESLVRRLAGAIVDALKAHGHILVVKGGIESLVRELGDLMTGPLAAVTPRLAPPGTVVGEVTSTFGDEHVDEAVEEMVGRVTHALMESDHVEDVFAEDNVIRRDVFRVVRDTLQKAPPPDEEEEEEGEGAISVRLDQLGYIAKAVAVRADAGTLREALERAAESVDAELETYEPDTREAMFAAHGGGPDRRLEIEETVADELADLVDAGLVELPTIERSFELAREVSPAERKDLRPRIDVISTRTLVRSGCAVTWEHEGPRGMKVTFTLLSDHDARELDQHLAAFARDVGAILAEPAPGDRRAAAATEGERPSAPPPIEAPARAARPAPTLADAADEILRRVRGTTSDAPARREPAKPAAPSEPPAEAPKPARRTTSPQAAATKAKPKPAAATKRAVAPKPAKKAAAGAKRTTATKKATPAKRAAPATKSARKR